MDTIRDLFIITLVAWFWSEINALFRIATLKTLVKENLDYSNDRNFLLYKKISLISLNLCAFIGIIIIGISFYNIVLRR